MLDYDGDYVNVFLDSDKNIVDRFVISSDGVRSKIIEIAKKEKTSTSNIVWPRHADGTCDYEEKKINWICLIKMNQDLQNFVSNFL